MFNKTPFFPDSQCNQSINDLMNDPATVKRLCVLLDPLEDFLKCVSTSYGLDSAEHAYILYHKDPHRYPVFGEILNHIKGTAKPEDPDRQNILTLLRNFHEHYEAFPDDRIGSAVETILSLHSACPVCRN